MRPELHALVTQLPASGGWIAADGIDTYAGLPDENGMRTPVPVAATPERQAASYAAALRRELEGVEFRLAHIDDPLPPWILDVPNPESVERQRVSLEGTRDVIVDELERLTSPDQPKEKRRGK